MTPDTDKAEVEVTCENCGSKTKKSVAWMKEHGEFECGCGTMIRVDPGRFRKELVNAESESDGSLGLLEKLGKEGNPRP